MTTDTLAPHGSLLVSWAFAVPTTNPYGLSNVGSYAKTSFVDIDSDGDLDAFIGNFAGDTLFFLNTGSTTSPVFAAPVTNAYGLGNVGSYANPSFSDIDGDGDLDAFIGNADGNTLLFMNTGSASNPAFAAPTLIPYSLSSGSSSQVDIDGDGDLDSFVGGADGNTLLLRNDSTWVVPVAATTADGAYRVGSVITLTMKFSENVLVTGTPTLSLATGATERLATYTGGSGTATLTFSYTVQAGDTSADLDYTDAAALALNGGTIRDATGNDAVLTLAAPGTTGSLAAGHAIVIDTSTPTTAIASLTMSADTGTSASDFITNTAAQTISGTTNAALQGDEIVQVSLDNGATWATAATTVGQNTWSLDCTLTGNGTLQVRVADAAGNTGPVATQAYVFDTTAPTTTIASVTLSADTGTNTTDFITSTAAQTISGTTSAALLGGEVVQVSLDNGASWTAAATAMGQNTWTLNTTLSGSNTLKVRVTDLAGNTSAETSQAYVLDTGAPTTTIASVALSADTGTSASDFITRTAAQTISGTTSAALQSGETVQVSLDNGATWATAAATVGQSTWSLGGQTLSGSDTLKVRVRDAAGNTGTEASQAYTLDTTAPTTTVATVALSADTGTSTTDFITRTAAQTISGTTSVALQSGEIVQVSFNNGSTWSTATSTAGQSTWSVNGTLSGNNTLKVRVMDAAGNTGTATSQAYTLDTTAPTTTIATIALSADTGTSASDFITKTAAQTISGTTSAALQSGEIVQVSLDNGTTWATAATTVGQNTWSLNATLSGSSTLKVRVMDTAGNTGTALSQAYVLDTSAPSTTIATMALSADTGTSASDFITNTAAQTISGTTSAALQSGEIVQVSLDNGSTWTTASTTVGQNTWSLAGQTLTGSSTLKVRVADQTGNTGTTASKAYVLDTTAPTTTIATMALSADTGTSASDFITRTAAQTISGTTSAAVQSSESVQVSLDNGATWATATTTVGQSTWSLAATLTGSNTLKVRVMDTAGNAGTTASKAYVLDTTAPTTTIATMALSADTGTSASDFITRTAAQTLSGTTSAALQSGEIVQVSLNNGSTWSTATTTVGQSTWSLNATLTGSNTLKVRVLDATGNAGTATSQAYTLDTTAPTTTIASVALSADTGTSTSDFITRTAAQTLSGTTSAALLSGETVQVSLDNGATWATAATTVGQSTWSLAGQTLSGNNTLKVRVMDAAGNTGTVASQAYVLDTTAPTATIATVALSADTGTSASDFITKTAAQTLSGTTSAALQSGEIVQVSLDNGATWATAATTAGQNTWSLDATLSASNTLKVRVMDTAGNTGATRSQAYVFDTAGASTTIASMALSADTGTSASDFATRTAAQTISGTTSAAVQSGESVQVSLNNGATWATASTTVGLNTWSLAGQTLTGSNTLKVRILDAAGNTGTEASKAYVLDTTAPTTTIATVALSADTGTSASDFLTKTAAQTISGTTSAALLSGEIVQVSLNNGSTWSTATSTVGQNTWSLAGKTLSTGSTIKVRVADAAGNVGTATSQAYVLDTTAPTTTIATVALSADTGASASDFITKTAAQTISGTTSAALQSGEIVQVSLDNGTTWATAATTTGQNTWSLAGQTLTGSNTLKVRVADTAGNTSAETSQAYVLDTGAPTTTIASMALSADTGTSASDFITSTAAQTISGTTSAALKSGEIVQVSLNNGSTWSTASTTVGQNTWSLAGQTLTGSSTLKVRVADQTGNTGTTASKAYVLDTTAPTTTIASMALSADTGTSASDFITRTAAQTISGTTSAALLSGEIVQVSLNNGSTWSTATTTVGQSTWSLAGQTLSGSNTLKVRVLDTAGNSSTVASKAYVLDTAAPTTTIATVALSADTGTSASDFITRTAAQTISGTTSAALQSGEIVQVSLNNGSTWSTATTTVGQNTWSLSGQTLSGSNTLKVRVMDAAGNTGTALSQAYVLDTAAPTTTIATVALSADTGTSSSDFITKTAAQTLSGTTSAALLSGEIVQVSLDNGTTWSTAATTVGQSTWSLAGQTLSGNNTLKVRVMDAAGNTGTVASQAYVLDTTAPSTTIATVALSADTGTSATDFITRTAAQTISGTTSAALQSGEIVQVSLDNGATWATAATTAGQSAWSLSATLTASSTLKVRVMDTAGNTGTTLSQAYVFDTTGATTTIATMALSADNGISSSDFITRTAAQTLSGTTSAALQSGESVQVSLDNGATWATATTTVGQNTWSLAGQTLTGSNTLKVRVRDAAGNTGTEASKAYVLDTTAPTTTIASVALSADTGTSASDFLTKTATQTLSGTTSAALLSGEIVQVSLNNGSTWSKATTTVGQNTWSLAGKTLSASNTLKVRVADAAGNVGTATSQAYVLDTTAPTTTIATVALSADTGTSASDFITKTAAQTISGTTSAVLQSGEIVQVSLDNGTSWATAATTTGQNTWSLAGQTLTGSNTLKVRVADTAGNTSAETSQAYVLDTAAPTTTIATMALSADTGTSASDFITSTAVQTISGTTSAALQSGEIVQVSLNNGSTWTTATTTAGQNTWSLNATLSGSSTLKVRVMDAAGNVGTTASKAYVLDTTAPTTTIASAALSADTGTSASDFITKTAAQTLSGTTSAALLSGETVQVSLDNGATWSKATTTVGQNTWSLAGQTLTGSGTLKVRVADAVGNTGAELSQAYVLDTTAPSTTIASMALSADTGTSASDFITSTAAQTISGTTSAALQSGEIVQVSLNNGSTWSTATTTTGQSTWSLAGKTLSGSNTLKVRMLDAAGNVGTEASQAYVLDTAAPTTTIASMALSADTGTSASDFITSTAAQAISGTTSAALLSGESVQVSLDNGATWRTATTTVGQSTWSLSSTLAGSGTLKVRVVDAAGGTSTAASQAYALDTAAPTVTVFTPADGAVNAAPGDDIVLTFSEALVKGSGNIVIKTAAGTVVATYDVATSANLTLNANTLTLNPSSNLAFSTAYKIELGAGTFKDLAGNSYAGSTSYNFNTIGTTYNGTTDADLLTGGVGNDTLVGGEGNDTLNGSSGTDSMTGGDGDDTYYVDNALDVVVETNADATTGGTDLVYSWLSAYTLGANVENGRIVTTAAATLTGNASANLLYAGAGNNVIDGGTESDMVSYRYATAGVTVNLSTTAAQATGGSGSDTLISVERLMGSSYADNLTGNADDNTLNGGSDTDTLSGGAGNDTLTGGLSTDQLTGGTGADRFNFNDLTELGLSITTRDTIVDFNSGEGDKIDLLDVDADDILVDDQAFTFLGTLDAFTGDATGQLRFDAVNHILYGSTNADTDAEFAIALTGVNSLSATDFVL